MSHLINLTRLRTVASALSELNEKVIFVGGAVVSLYTPNSASDEPRPTNDVDLILEVTTYAEFSGQIEERLRQLGFVNDTESGVICRYLIQGIIVDIMPANENVLGFSNRWYEEGLLTAINYPISEQQSIRILSAPYFIATKLEAFNSFRHGQDPRMNSDFEDLIYVFDNRESLLGEIYTCPATVRSYLQAELKNLLKDPNVYEHINTHLERTTASQRTRRMLTIWNEVAAL